MDDLIAWLSYKARNYKVLTLVKSIFLFIGITLTMNSHAKSQALLIGIGQYSGHQALEGPINDVELMQNILLQNDDLRRTDIKVLTDQKATRSNILNALDNIQKSTKRGDKVILYFSGHGTSALNVHIDAGLPSHSGALVPYDIDGASTKKELNQQLILGRRDLRPVLSNLDASGVEVLVIVDACFSGNVVRGDRDVRSLPTKFLDFTELLQFGKKETNDSSAGLVQTEQYPYKNVFLISAAQEDQLAHDIPKDRVAEYGTIDSKPHGAFTDSLAQSLFWLFENVDGVRSTMTLAELHVATRRLMKKKGFFSTPSLLPNNSTRTEAGTLYRFFGQSVSMAGLRRE